METIKGLTHEEVEEKRVWGKRNNNKIVSMPQMQQVKMVISQPTSFEQSENIPYPKRPTGVYVVSDSRRDRPL